ncbi:MAG: bifunctional DNA-formamidopyrimidine glycosylase/DNA-(apurinic or apyrimidinic site) lyase [Patescibacteria group bacterium]
MPELPEVHTITNDIKPFVKGATITNVKLVNGYIPYPDSETFVTTLKGKKILKADRIAKNILLEIEDEYFVTIHLAMTGRALLRRKNFLQDKWERIIFELKNKDKNLELRFCDMRMFGKVKLLDKLELNELKNKYGPEPIDENLTPEEFLEQIKSKQTSIKNVLLDQAKVAGLGNVYATEALWMSKIHPETSTKNITLKEATALLKASREILNEGIKNRGISMSDYVDAFGKKGNQQNFFRIYQKDICSECKTNVEFKKINGRGTYFCPTCQSKDGKNRLI